MAIVWGNTSGGFRLGIETTVSDGTMTIVVYGQTFYAHRWYNTLYFSGDWEGEKRVGVFSENGRTMIHELHRSAAKFTGTRRYAASIDYWNGSASVSTTVTIAPPIVHPAAPTNLRITSGDDAKVSLAWTNPTAYDQIKVVCRGWYKWRTTQTLVKTVAGSATSTTVDLPSDLGFECYQWRLVGSKSGLGSAYSNPSPWYYTTPDKVGGVRVTRAETGAVISWDNPNVKELVFEVQRNGQRLGETSVGATPVSSYTDTTVGNGVFTYRVRAGVKNWDNQVKWGPFSEASNELVTIAPPRAPINLKPDKTYAGVGEEIQFSWQHNPVDSSQQTAAQLQFVSSSGGPGLTSRVQGGAQALTRRLPAGEWTWTVRTKGMHADYGPKAAASLTVIPLPVARIVKPATGAGYNSRRLAVQWAYTHENPQFTQTGWEIELRKDGRQIQTLSGTGSTNTATFTTELEDKASYEVVLVVETRGVKSAPVRMPITTLFKPPAEPTITATWDENTGCMNVEVAAVAGDVPAVSLRVQASDDEGQTWRTLGEINGSSLSVSDYIAKSQGATIYRADAYAESGASSQAWFEAKAFSQAIWIGGGADFSETARLPYNPEVSVVMRRERARVSYAGRSLPVAYADSLAYRTVKTSGRIWEPDPDNATLVSLRHVAQHPHPVHLYRDPAGNQIFGILTDAHVERESDGLWKWQASLEETERGARL